VVAPDLPVSDFVRFAQQAGRSGFAEPWIVEDCFLHGGTAQAAVAVYATSRIQIGIGILPAAARNVAFASMDVATLANIFPGRLIVGVGHGMPKWLRPTGSWPASPLTPLEQYITAMKDILTG
jgi:alkanesulfonate monooxygenase SsuD/methylene tetrahydromethanopterin reductase-like flavin-dependent oxidoreductase (luciferase family)